MTRTWSERTQFRLNLLALAFTLTIVVLDYLVSENFFEHTWLQACFYIFPVTTVVVNNFVLVPRLFDRGRYRAYAAALVTTVLATLLVSRHFADPAYFNRYWFYWVLDFVRFLVSVLAAFGLVAFGRLVVQQNRQLQQQLLLQRSELQHLKGQINPHFLFNTLNNLYYLCLERSDKAAGMVEQLAGLMRYNLDAGRHDRVPLEEEYRFIEQYAQLEQARLPPAARVQVQRAGAFAAVRLAPFLLVPFVENCFKHGAGRLVQAPFVLVRVEMQDGKLFFYAENSRPTPAERGAVVPSGLGLANVRERLRLLYPNRHELTLDETDHRFVVSLMIDFAP